MIPTLLALLVAFIALGVYGVILLAVFVPRARQEGFAQGYDAGRVHERTRDLVRDGLSPRQARTRALQQVTR